MSRWKARLAERLKSPSRRMHPFPCSALLACFGNTRETAAFDQPSAADTPSTVFVQPEAKAGRHPSHPRREEGTPEKRRDAGTRSERNGSANRNSSNHTAVQPAGTPVDLPRSLDGASDCEAVTFQTSIPRPSIIEMPAVSAPSVTVGGVALGESPVFGSQRMRREAMTTSSRALAMASVDLHLPVVLQSQQCLNTRGGEIESGKAFKSFYWFVNLSV
ncbi:uncharacterized protein [Physeter macrocephalus]|uniref:Uncharacterized protein n=1 Tax=Physeter macrocephalus TaxID=9755 RepID=A0A455BPS9_PHYMC|nr:uncharacterized protein LOC114487079 [Physeter catodon]|eukprot:XP_028350959.1 uncharacterized protein LOC114487079 [Physeter catodon]